MDRLKGDVESKKTSPSAFLNRTGVRDVLLLAHGEVMGWSP